MTGEEGRSNPQIVVNGASIRAMERGATLIGGASASREVEKRGKSPHPKPREPPYREPPPRGERRRGEGRIARMVAVRHREEDSRRGKESSRTVSSK